MRSLPGYLHRSSKILSGILENNARCRDTRHVGQEYSDVLTTLFILAWIQVVPSLLAIIQYFSAFFSKQRKIICCNEKWKKAKIEADQASDVSTDEGGYRWVISLSHLNRVFNSRMTILKSLTNIWWYQNHKILFRWFPPETEVDQTRFNSLLQKSFIAVLIHLQLLLGHYFFTKFMMNLWILCFELYL